MPRLRTAASCFSGRNFMTPDVLRLGTRGELAFELSTGTFLDKPLFGVTLASRVTGERLHDQSRCFESRAAAQSYIDNLAPAC